MKRIIPIILLSLSCYVANAQIFATTSAGKKVLLNTDGTWKYAEATDAESPCTKNKTGNLTVKNSTASDIYFYYNVHGNQYVKVKAGVSKTISNIVCCPSYSDNSTPYSWVATLEIDMNNSHISSIQGIERGNFSITPCQTEEIEIDN